jgi:hypothetical protein
MVFFDYKYIIAGRAQRAPSTKLFMVDKSAAEIEKEKKMGAASSRVGGEQWRSNFYNTVRENKSRRCSCCL